MNNSPAESRLAVCSWSLQPLSPQDLLKRLESTGIPRVQLALDPLRESPVLWDSTQLLFEKSGVSIVSGMFGCIGEDYSSLDSIRLTGGIAPDSTWDQNLKNIQATATIARKLQLKLVTFHAGFLPHDENDPGFAKLFSRLQQVADVFATQNMILGLETGQETALALRHLLQKLSRPNVGVNFDPANMLLYDKGNPIDALGVLGPWIRQVHIKDARRTRVPGTWGEEVAAGSGEVDWNVFFTTLNHLGYAGDFVIEREAGNQRSTDIIQAKDLVSKIVS